MKHKQEIRKGFEWFRTLTKKQQKRFRLECHRYMCRIGSEGARWFHWIMNEVSDFNFFMNGSFTKDESVFGLEYWNNIRKR